MLSLTKYEGRGVVSVGGRVVIDHGLRHGSAGVEAAFDDFAARDIDLRQHAIGLHHIKMRTVIGEEHVERLTG